MAHGAGVAVCCPGVRSSRERVYHRVHCSASGLSVLWQWCLCSPSGEGVPGWDPTKEALRILFPAVASGQFSGFPWNKPKTTSVPLSVPFRTIWNFFSSIQNYLRISCREISESKDSETFPSALLWLIYNIESVYGVQLLIWYTSVLQNYHHHSFIWQLNHVT